MWLTRSTGLLVQDCDNTLEHFSLSHTTGTRWENFEKVDNMMLWYTRKYCDCSSRQHSSRSFSCPAVTQVLSSEHENELVRVLPIGFFLYTSSTYLLKDLHRMNLEAAETLAPGGQPPVLHLSLSVGFASLGSTTIHPGKDLSVVVPPWEHR